MKHKKRPTTGCGHPDTRDNHPVTLQALVDKYLTGKHYWKKVNQTVTDKEGLELFLSSLEDFTAYICGENNIEKVCKGKKYKLNGHQQWLNGKWDVINKVACNLKNIGKEEFASFEELIDYVDSKKEKYFGDTAVYDFSLRYGWHHNPRIEPKDYVYTHSQPRKGALLLKKLGYLENVARRIKISDFPDELRHPDMTAKDIENFLCIYHDEIKNLPPKK